MAVVPYIGTWIETHESMMMYEKRKVVPYIGTWIETTRPHQSKAVCLVVPYIGTWIETSEPRRLPYMTASRTLYRYVD